LCMLVKVVQQMDEATMRRLVLLKQLLRPRGKTD